MTLIWHYHHFNRIYVNQLEIICMGTVVLANCNFILWSDMVAVILAVFELAVNNKMTRKCGSLTSFYKKQNNCFLIIFDYFYFIIIIIFLSVVTVSCFKNRYLSG